MSPIDRVRIDDMQAYQYAVKAPEVFKSFMKSFIDFIVL